MKKKFILTFVIAICAFFGFSLSGKAEQVCKYIMPGPDLNKNIDYVSNWGGYVNIEGQGPKFVDYHSNGVKFLRYIFHQYISEEKQNLPISSYNNFYFLQGYLFPVRKPATYNLGTVYEIDLDKIKELKDFTQYNNDIGSQSVYSSDSHSNFKIAIPILGEIDLTGSTSAYVSSYPIFLSYPTQQSVIEKMQQNNEACPSAIIVASNYTLGETFDKVGIIPGYISQIYMEVPTSFYLADVIYSNGFENEEFEKSLAASLSGFDLTKRAYAVAYSYHNTSIEFTNQDATAYYGGKECLLNSMTTAFYPNTTSRYNDVEMLISGIQNSYKGLNLKNIFNDFSKIDLEDSKSVTQFVKKNSDFFAILYDYKVNNSDKIQNFHEQVKQLTSGGELGCINKFYSAISSKKTYYDWFDTYDKNNNIQYAALLSSMFNIVSELDDKHFNGIGARSCPDDDYICLCKYNDSVKDTYTSNYIDGQYSSVFVPAEEYCRQNPDFAKEKAKETKKQIDKLEQDFVDSISEIISNNIDNIAEDVGIKLNNVSQDKLCKILYDEKDGIGIYINGSLTLIKIAGPILVIVLTGLDAMKVFADGKGDESKKFFNRLKVRIICLVLLFLVPTIIQFLIDLIIKDNVCHL